VTLSCNWWRFSSYKTCARFQAFRQWKAVSWAPLPADWTPGYTTFFWFHFTEGDQPTFRDSLKAAKLVLVSRLLSRLRDLFRWRGTLREASGVKALSPLARLAGCSSATISRLLRRMPRPTHGKEPRLDASRYLASSTLDLKGTNLIHQTMNIPINQYYSLTH